LFGNWYGALRALPARMAPVLKLGGLNQLSDKARKAFFFKKRTKNFYESGLSLSGNAEPIPQKFFASFFQESRPSLIY
jgi:hypothetical protein